MSAEMSNDTGTAQRAAQTVYLVRPGKALYHEHHGGHRAVCGAMRPDMTLTRERPSGGRLCERCVARRQYWARVEVEMRRKG